MTSVVLHSLHYLALCELGALLIVPGLDGRLAWALGRPFRLPPQKGFLSLAVTGTIVGW